jgi:hypothetical protein
VLNAVETTSVSSAAISEPMPVSATTQRVADLLSAWVELELTR